MNFLILSQVLLIAFAKHYLERFNVNSFSQIKWQYLTKFGIDTSGGQVEARVQLLQFSPKNSENVKLDLFLYDESSLHMLEYISQLARALEEKQCLRRRELAKERIVVFAPKNEKFTEWMKRILPKNETPQLWYIAIADCDNNLQNYKFQSALIKVEVIFKNRESHFSVEDQGFQQLYFIQMVLTMTMASFIITRVIRYKKDQEEEYDKINIFIVVSLGCDLISELLLYMNLEVYAYDGEGLYLPNFLGQFLSEGAQFVISYMLIQLATGYQIEQKQRFQIAVRTNLIGLQVIIFYFWKLYDDSNSYSRDPSGTTEIFLFLLKISLLVWFLVNIYYYYQQKEDGHTLLFLSKLRVFGSIYFLVFPILMVCNALFVEPYLRHKVMIIGTGLFHHISILIMYYAFGTKRGTYQMIRQRGNLLII